MIVKYGVALLRGHSWLLDFIIMFHTFILIVPSSITLSDSSQFKATEKYNYTDV